MALIKCPECGKEVSDKATACINCGFPLSNAQTVVEEDEHKNPVVYCDIRKSSSEMIFDNGLENGIEGVCKDGAMEYPYQVKNDIVYIKQSKDVFEYIIADDFLANLNGKTNGNIPDVNLFDATVTNAFGSTTFRSNGTYTGTSFGSPNSGRYIRDNNIIAICGSDTGHKPFGKLIYNNTMYVGSYIKKEELGKLNDVLDQFGLSRNTDTITAPKPSAPVIKCPYCQSSNTKKISSTAKAVNVALFGIFGNKRKYQWHCNNCNSDF